MARKRKSTGGTALKIAVFNDWRKEKGLPKPKPMVSHIVYNPSVKPF
ncbi:MAG TPA: hypothetical protein VN922_15635 [Bacteroidia bacterium]|nr:hypothetical protein [Bacteroidia bacterium]